MIRVAKLSLGVIAARASRRSIRRNVEIIRCAEIPRVSISAHGPVLIEPLIRERISGEKIA